MRQRYEVDGREVPPDELVETARGWVEPAPVFCPRGHRLDIDIVAWRPCAVDGGRSGHRIHWCKCGGGVFTPPLDEAWCACEDRSQPPRAR